MMPATMSLRQINTSKINTKRMGKAKRDIDKRRDKTRPRPETKKARKDKTRSQAKT